MRIFAILTLAPALWAQSVSSFEAHLASGRTALSQSRYADAARELRLAVDDRAAGPRMVEALEALCDLNLLLGKYAEAIELQERAVASTQGEEDLVPRLIRLAGAYRAGGKASEALLFLVRALTIDTKASGPDSAKVAFDYDSIASVYTELRDYPRARNTWQTALDSRIRRLGEDHLDVANNYLNLGSLEEKAARPALARAHFEKALAISESKVGPENYALTGILDRLGLLLRSMKNLTEAVPVFQRSLAIREKTLGARHGEIAPALDNLAMTYFFDGKFAEAEPLFTRSLQIWLQSQGPYSPLVARALENIGAVYSSQQRYPEAEIFFKRALSIHERQDIDSLSNLALVYASAKDMKRAEIYFLRAILIGEKGLGGDHVDEVTAVMEQYAVFLRGADRPIEAKKLDARIKLLRDRAEAEKKNEK